MSWRPLAALAAAMLCAACALPAAEVSVAPGQAAAAPASAAVPAGRWRAVLVAGDNDSPAFDNGVELLRAKLAARGVRDIGLYSADPGRVAAGHLASAANLRRALSAGGGDACLAFVTSHGEADGFFLRADRLLFSPELLDRVLAEGCGSVPTVLIVSACHSGAFINQRTRRPNRVILTAAAADRASFGCGAEDAYTHYDRCLLQQFDLAATWRELARATTACVARRERQLGIARPSMPQAFIGAAVAGLRLPGR